MIKIHIRNGAAADWDSLAAIFHQSVREGATAYTHAQRSAWSPVCRAGADWALRMSRQMVWVAEADGAPAGFMSLEMNGYLDCAYILPRWHGKGIFRQLYVALEARARADKRQRIHTHASLHARRPFAAMGFSTLRPETVEMRTGIEGQSVWLPRFAMEKRNFDTEQGVRGN